MFRTRFFFLGNLLLLHIFLVSPVFATTERWVTYTNSNYVQDLAVEGNFIWCATTGGVTKFNVFDTTFTKYTNADGLADIEVRAVVIDSLGNKWFGTADGLSRFDGSSWKNYSSYELPSSNILSLTTGSGKIWVGTDQGFCYFDGTNFSIPYDQGNVPLPDNSISVLLCQRDTLWIGTSKGLCRVPVLFLDNPLAWQKFDTTNSGIISNQIQTVCKKDSLLFVGSVRGVSRFNGMKWDTLNAGLPSLNVRDLTFSADTLWAATANGACKLIGTTWVIVNTGLLSRNLYALAVTQTGQLWTGSWGEGIAKLEGSIWHIYCSNGPAWNFLGSGLAFDLDGSVWATHCSAGAGPGGLSQLDRQGNWNIYNSANSGFVTNTLPYLDIDRDGNKWIGTWGYGLIKMDNTGRCTTYTNPTPLLGRYVLDIYLDEQNNRYFVTWVENGVSVLTKENTWQYHYDPFITNTFPHCVVRGPDGTIWVGTKENGLARINPDETWTYFNPSNSGIASGRLQSMVFDNEGNLWLGTFGGVSRFDGSSFTNFTMENSPLRSNVIIAVKVDPIGNKWFATLDAGLYCLDAAGNWSVYAKNDLGRRGSKLVDDHLNSLALRLTSSHCEEIWIGSVRGLNCLILDNPESSEPNKAYTYPNPFRPEIHKKLTFAEIPDNSIIKIFTLSGELIKEIGQVNTFTHTAVWDGKNERGVMVASGIYLFLVKTDKQTKLGKFAVVR
ncbi:MAG: hypothetical protein AB1393_04940 [Candidatus Edwardsbacteria bacterium]